MDNLNGTLLTIFVNDKKNTTATIMVVKTLEDGVRGVVRGGALKENKVVKAEQRNDGNWYFVVYLT